MEMQNNNSNNKSEQSAKSHLHQKIPKVENASADTNI
jgi:hypothetical protein